MTLRDFVYSSRERLRAIYPPVEASRIVDIVCREVLGIEGYRVHVEGEKVLADDALRSALEVVWRLEKHEPWQYVLGFADFYGRRFRVTPATLIPRPETETLCRHALDYARGLNRPVRVLDLCTGSGCIAWTMAAELSDNSRCAVAMPFPDGSLCAGVVGIDISAPALEVARGQFSPERASRQLSQECETSASAVTPVFYQADIFDDAAMDGILSRYGCFDIVISNPPYILRKESAGMRRNVLDYEPDGALFVPDDNPMLFNKKIAEIFSKCSYMDSALFVEINENQGIEAQNVMGRNGALEVTILEDDFGRNRIAMAKKKYQ